MNLIMNNTDIRFPNLGIVFENLGNSISIGGFSLKYYGIIIGIGMILAILLVEWMAKRTGQNPDDYIDLAFFAIIIGIVGARLYYVAFNFDSFKGNLLSILNLRTGGLAIYGGAIFGVTTAYIYCKKKKMNLPLVFDTGILGLLVGQIIGRWGNFFNREVFGCYTNSLFAMQIDVTDAPYDFQCSVADLQARYVNQPQILSKIMEVRENAVVIDGATYLQVHPTFLYESFFNLLILIFLILYTKHKKFNGEIFFGYGLFYGALRFVLEGMRTDRLFIKGTPIAVSQLFSAIICIASFIAIVVGRVRQAKKEFAASAQKVKEKLEAEESDEKPEEAAEKAEEAAEKEAESAEKVVEATEKTGKSEE